MRNLRRSQRRARVGRIRIDTLGIVDMSQGRPADWKAIQELMSLLSEPLRRLACNRWRRLHPEHSAPDITATGLELPDEVSANPPPGTDQATDAVLDDPNNPAFAHTPSAPSLPAEESLSYFNDSFADDGWTWAGKAAI
jgi:hypothetical protein